MIQKYTLGFLFNHDLTKVLLIHKLRPEWQNGKINGLGGKYEKNETAKECIVREIKEETNLKTNSKEWQKIGELHSTKFAVDVMGMIYQGKEADAVSIEEEKVEWFLVNSLPKNIMTNLSWLIPLTIETLREKEIKLMIAQYKY